MPFGYKKAVGVRKDVSFLEIRYLLLVLYKRHEIINEKEPLFSTLGGSR